MINLKKLAIHEIVKESQTNEATTFLSNSCLNINNVTSGLVEQLNASYKSDSLIYAVFDFSPDKYFPSQFSSYENLATTTNANFLTFTQNVTTNLRNQIVNITLAKGGYLVYVEYVFNNINYLGIFFIRDATGVVFNKNTTEHNVEVTPTTYMNIDKLVMACRINLDKYSSNNGKYLTFLRRRQAEVSDYFLNWISIILPESSKEFTETLYSMVNNMSLPIDPDTGVQYDLNSYRQKIVNYIREKNKIVDLHDLGRFFYQDENKFIEYRDENAIEIDNEFKADGKTLKKFQSIEIKAKGIQLKFSRGLLASGDIYIGRGEQIIIKSEALQNELRKEIE